MRGAYDSHECPVEQIKTVKVAKAHLCELANYRGRLRPEMCQECTAACKYGMKMLELMGLPIHEKKRDAVSVADLSRQGQALPTLHMRLKKRGK